MRLLTQSQIRCYRGCGRRHLYQYTQLVRPVAVPEAYRIGTLWHKCRAAWWSAAVGKRLAAGLEMLQSLALEDSDPYMFAKLGAMLVGYDRRWSDDLDLNYDVLGVEQSFETVLSNPVTDHESRTWRFGGQLDAIVRERSTGRILVVEEKTASGDLSPESPYWRRLEIDPQVSAYYSGAASLGHGEISGCLYYVTVKPKLQPKKATPEESRKFTQNGKLYATQRMEDETPQEFRERCLLDIAEKPEHYFQRVEVTRLEADIKESTLDIWHTAKAIRASERTGIWLRNPDACISLYGSACPYLAVCTRRASLGDPALYRKATTEHEELVTDGS